MLLVPLVERPDRSEVQEWSWRRGNLRRVVLSKGLDLEARQKVVIFAAGEQVRVGLIDDHLAL